MCEEQPRQRARCQGCDHWFFEDTLAHLRIRPLRWDVLLCRRCLDLAKAQIKGIRYQPIDGWKKGRNR